MNQVRFAVALVVVTVIGILSFQLWNARHDIATEVAKNATLSIAKKAAEVARERIEKESERSQELIRNLENAKRTAEKTADGFRERLDALATEPTEEGKTDAPHAARPWIDDLGALNADVNRMLERQTNR